MGHKSGQETDDLCVLCGEGVDDSDHFRRCKKLAAERWQVDPRLAAFSPSDVPPAVRHGIPPSMTAALEGSFWPGGLASSYAAETAVLFGAGPNPEVDQETRDYVQPVVEAAPQYYCDICQSAPHPATGVWGGGCACETKWESLQDYGWHTAKQVARALAADEEGYDPPMPRRET